MVLDLSLTPAAGVAERSLTLLPEIIDEYLITLKLDGKSQLTRENYQRNLKVFCTFVATHKGNFAIRMITRYYVRCFLAYLDEERKVAVNGKSLSKITVNRYYRALHAFFEWCIREGYIAENDSPMRNINPPKYPRTVPRPFSKDDWKKLLFLTEGNRYLEIRNRALILVGYDTGLRVSELAAMKAEEVNIESGLVRVMGKGAKERLVRIGIAARKALLKYMRFRNRQLADLWQTEERRPLQIRGMQSAIKKLCRRAGIEDAKPGPHTLRHSCAFASLANGATIYDVKVLFGHEDIRTTQRYEGGYTSEIVCEKHTEFSPGDRLLK